MSVPAEFCFWKGRFFGFLLRHPYVLRILSPFGTATRCTAGLARMPEFGRTRGAMHLTAVSALAGSALVSTFSATAAFSVCGYGGGLLAPSKVLPASAVSRLGRSHSARTRAGVHAGLRMGFLDNMFKPAVSEEDPLWMQRDFKVAGRKLSLIHI